MNQFLSSKWTIPRNVNVVVSTQKVLFCMRLMLLIKINYFFQSSTLWNLQFSKKINFLKNIFKSSNLIKWRMNLFEFHYSHIILPFFWKKKQLNFLENGLFWGINHFGEWDSYQFEIFCLQKLCKFHVNTHMPNLSTGFPNASFIIKKNVQNYQQFFPN